jgi:hypothetical protein
MNTTGPANEAHQRHMENLKQCGTVGRARDYIEDVRRTEGKFAAKWLSDEFWKWLEQRNGKAGVR